MLNRPERKHRMYQMDRTMFFNGCELNLRRVATALRQIVEKAGGRCTHEGMMNAGYSSSGERGRVFRVYPPYVRFLLGDMVYYVEFDDNPFFPFLFTKTPIKAGAEYSLDVVARDLPKWMFDRIFFRTDVRDGEVWEAACEVFKVLLDAEESEVDRERSKKRVPNTYNNGFHWEIALNPERTKEIDW